MRNPELKPWVQQNLRLRFSPSYLPYCLLVDAFYVPTADNKVYFKVSGAGSNAGVGNGDSSCHEPNHADHRGAFKGYCMVLVQANQTVGTLSVTARSNGLLDASVQLVVDEKKNEQSIHSMMFCRLAFILAFSSGEKE